jgi:hypothetical protein
MQFDLTIPNDKAEIIIEAVCATYNYQPVINEEPNPEAPEDFAKRMVVEFIQTITKNYITDKAIAQARQEVEQSIDLSGIN